ncbi:16284_t:CDS:2 [Funneliformis mosseae]|uniref:chitin synthase n=1 Tax=Funneliformis mosseae TaxID=27381 RepID=A0A9N8ZDT2_FUNMO|nr:16284_t:CDS:2 [Funneliformis mosseae]
MFLHSKSRKPLPKLPINRDDSSSSEQSYRNQHQKRYQRQPRNANSPPVSPSPLGSPINKGVSDFYQNVYRPSSGGSRNNFSERGKARASVASMPDSNIQPAERSPSSSSSSQTLFQKDFDKLATHRSNTPANLNNLEQNVQDNVEMNVLNDRHTSLPPTTSMSHRPRPQAEGPTPLSPERPKSPSKGLIRMPSIIRGLNDSTNAETANSPPRRQKSLVRPERARNNNYRNSRIGTSARQMYDDQIGDEETKRWSVFSGPGGDDRRKSLMSKRSSKEPPRKKKWYQCQCPSYWVLFSRVITFWAPSSILSCCGMHDRSVQQAWREKIALVTIIILLCILVGLLTFSLRDALCRKLPFETIPVGRVVNGQATILGKIYDLQSYHHKVVPPFVNNSDLSSPENALLNRADLSFLFQSVNFECKDVLKPDVANADGSVLNYFPCVPVREYDIPNPDANPEGRGCHPNYSERVDALSQFKLIGEIYFEWRDVENSERKYVVYNGHVLDLDRFQWTVPNINLPEALNKLIDDDDGIFHGHDITHYLQTSHEMVKIGKCMDSIVRVGVVSLTPPGCLVTDVITYVSLIVIVSVVLVRFFLAVLFGWVLSWRLGNFREETAEEIAQRESDIERWSNETNHLRSNARDSRQDSASSFNLTNKSRFSTLPPGSAPFVERRRPTSRQLYPNQPGMKNFNDGSTSSLLGPMSTNGNSVAMTKDSNGLVKTSHSSFNENNSQGRTDSLSSTSSDAQVSSHPNLDLTSEARLNFSSKHTIMLVTCYSEGLQGIRTTLNSLANTDYPTSHKLIMVIADGVIFGAGNELSTPDICLSLMSDFVVPVDNVMAHSYVAIADGKKRHNMAKVYAGYYRYKDSTEKVRKVPMVTIVKCGGPDEQDDKKPGNRGKRDSQIILMSFLQKVMFDDRMTPLEYEFFNSIRTVTGVTPDFFEIVLMVDADTNIYADSVTRMVACMANDSSVMGICGETKIANKSDSWVTMIQVFEYYISHHMQKAFESIFGGVTCLPGCFCMYRIKAPKGDRGYWVPILANPDIVEQYSENIVDTLHKKNLLLLGEDRYLSTLMLRTFPKRKMMFVPQAVCKTIVPDTFRVLRSQRRRWINSTVHNLLELVLIPDLCGTFCFSMQFVIFMELVGTVVLPAAISFTVYLIIISIVKKPVQIIPLALLAAVLGLPAILILLTTRKIVYVGWMLIYLLSLPIWNFVLPVYSFWHFDDFSWGQTRIIKDEEAGTDHSRKEGEFDSTKIVMKKWAEWEREKYLKSKNPIQQQISSVLMSPEERFQNSIRQGGNEKSSYQTITLPRGSAKRNTTVVAQQSQLLRMIWRPLQPKQ